MRPPRVARHRSAVSEKFSGHRRADKQFYTRQLGWEVRSDFSTPELGDFRWLTVSPKDQPDVAIALMAVPGQPVMDDRTPSV